MPRKTTPKLPEEAVDVITVQMASDELVMVIRAEVAGMTQVRAMVTELTQKREAAQQALAKAVAEEELANA